MKSDLVTIAAAGPFDDDSLSEPTMRVCDVGHMAIAWRDWDGAMCPLCSRVGTLSGILAAAMERVMEETIQPMQDDLDNASETEEKYREAIKGAKLDLRKVLDDIDTDASGDVLTETTRAVLEAIYVDLLGAL